MIPDHEATGSPKHTFAETLFRRPSVKILFYTDDDLDLILMDKESEFGVGRLAELIKESTPSYVNIEIDFIRRHDGGHAEHKLTAELVGQYDEVWFFGLKLANTASAAENELTDAEISVLSTWMNTGGTLITGDHANPRPSDVDPNLDSLLNLGRAIGHKVPRAGKLRRWEGQPGADPPDNYNTHTPVQYVDIEDLDLDSDGNPQQLIMKKFPVHGRFDLGTTIPTRWRPHPLFCGKRGVIDIFPDHMHEGHLVIPKPDADWPTGPSGIQPMPEIVAWGVDSCNGRVIDVVSAYDGDQGDVGRIVADSTWHHYFNMNLQGFPRLSTDLSQGYQLRILADYYINLAIWLAPIAKRSAMVNRLLWDIATHGSVLEVKGNSYRTLGRLAFRFSVIVQVSVSVQT